MYTTMELRFHSRPWSDYFSSPNIGLSIKPSQPPVTGDQVERLWPVAKCLSPSSAEFITEWSYTFVYLTSLRNAQKKPFKLLL